MTQAGKGRNRGNTDVPSTRSAGLAKWRQSVREKITQHRFACISIRNALSADWPLQELHKMFPTDPEGVNGLAGEEKLQRAALARSFILRQLNERPEWRSKVFAEALCVSPERIRQLRREVPTSIADLGIALGRPSDIRLPRWEPLQRPTRLRRKRNSSEPHKPNQRELIKQLVLAIAADMGREGVSTYLVNMALGNSDLPSRNVEWRIVELGKDGYLDHFGWTDGRRKKYKASCQGRAFLEDEGISASGSFKFSRWLDQIPRLKRDSGLPPGAPVVLMKDDRREVSAREWVGLREPPTNNGGCDLAKAHSTLDPAWAEDASSLLPSWADQALLAKGIPLLADLLQGRLQGKPTGDSLAAATHAIRIEIHRILHREAARKGLTMAAVSRDLGVIMTKIDPKYPPSRPEAIAKLGPIPTEQEARHLERILGSAAGTVTQLPALAPWAVSRMRTRSI